MCPDLVVVFPDPGGFMFVRRWPITSRKPEAVIPSKGGSPAMVFRGVYTHIFLEGQQPHEFGFAATKIVGGDARQG
ncbi:hypothetical protein DESC_830067 [Desulfosarcina cetonica]|nr:hypothetical protein DESC_830067 [Desulfosarcina cetonica]